MKIITYADLHLEDGGDIPKPKYVPEIILIAGDTDKKADGFKKLRKAFPYSIIIAVNGNREYHDANFHSINKESEKEAKKNNIILLNNSFVTISGITFFGGPMWTNLSLGNRGKGWSASIDHYVREKLSDCQKIRIGTFKKMDPKFMVSEYNKFITNLKYCLNTSIKTVVITHHAPSIRSIVPRARGHISNGAYANGLDGLILEYQKNILLWCHGHTHTTSDYHIGSTRVVSNPRCSITKPNPFFKKDWLIDIDTNFKFNNKE